MRSKSALFILFFASACGSGTEGGPGFDADVDNALGMDINRQTAQSGRALQDAEHGHVSVACAPAWAATSVYTQGNQASQNSINYVANWWTQGEAPSSHNGGAGSGQVWTSKGACVAQTSSSTSTSPTTAGPSSSNPAATSPSTGSASQSAGAAAPSVPVQSTGQAAGSAAGGSATTSGVFFSPYKDVTINANWNTEVISTAVTGSLTPLLTAVPNLPALTWAFATGECGNETWGGIAGAQLAQANVAAFAAAKKPYILSTGGAAGAFSCSSDAGFFSFIDRYASNALVGVDFDIEAGQSQAVVDALVARVKAAQANPKYASLRFSFTIATLGGNAGQSLGAMGIMVMQSIKNAGLSGAIINLMAMDYGAATPGNCVIGKMGTCDMGASAVQAAVNLHNTYNVPYNQIALTPMIGGNDTRDETFTLDDVVTVSAFAKQNKLAGLHIWSLDRDTDCAPGYASPVCNSYGKSGALGFMRAFMQNL